MGSYLCILHVAELVFAEWLDSDRSDVSFVPIQVGVTGGQSAHGEQFAIAEMFGQAVEAPAHNHHVGRGEGEREFFRWSLRTATIAAVIGLEAVVKKLAVVEAVAVLARGLPVGQEELDTGTMLLSGEDAFVFFELVQAHKGRFRF